jgi:protein associated with RNAse G/E
MNLKEKIFRYLDIEEHSQEEIKDLEYMCDRIETISEFIDDIIELDTNETISLAKQYQALKLNGYDSKRTN